MAAESGGQNPNDEKKNLHYVQQELNKSPEVGNWDKLVQNYTNP